MFGRTKGESASFFEKKKQKNFCELVGTGGGGLHSMNRRFLLLFYKKADLVLSHQTQYPPSASTIDPVIKLDASDARK
ncbi:MAG: hypothetical protein POH28_16230 [Acidocella sp.]|nr:hypothetical protein [Acidocella sp.]